MLKIIRLGRLLAVSICLLTFSIATAAVPGLISYQGRITTATGIPVSDGAYFIRFQIYDAPVGGTSLWNSGIQMLQVTGGLYTYILGQDVAFPNGLFTGGNRWLGITMGLDPESTPRKQLIATSYAFVSQIADSVNWAGIKGVPAGFADGVDNNSGGDITAVNASGGITGGVATGDANLSIAGGGVTSTHIGDGQILNADISANAAIAPSKINGTAATLAGTQTFTGQNIFGDSVKLSGVFIPGIDAFDDSIVVSINRAYNFPGAWVYPFKCSFTNLAGSITGSSLSVSGGPFHVYGSRTDVYGDGVSRIGALFSARPRTTGLTTGTSTGLMSFGFDGTTSFGVWGSGSSSTVAMGVHGEASSASQEGQGVNGVAFNNPNRGVGVYGGARNNSWGVGVYGEAWENTNTNWAGYFGGDVNVTGTVYMPAKVSRIDHPLDPENKYLQHSDIQSPEMLNVYTGNTVTDDNGDAVVALPDYFAEINRDFRYQLTVVGQFAQAIVAKKVEDSQFSIKTDKPGVEVSWQVTGIRQDKYAQAHRVENEVAKLPQEVGKYLHPELYGLGHDRSMTAKIRELAMKAIADSREQAKTNDAERESTANSKQ